MSETPAHWKPGENARDDLFVALAEVEREAARLAAWLREHGGIADRRSHLTILAGLEKRLRESRAAWDAVKAVTP